MPSISVFNVNNTNYDIRDIDFYNALAEAYSNQNTYEADDYCVYQYKLYQCNTAISVPENFNSNKWDEVQLLGGA